MPNFEDDCFPDNWNQIKIMEEAQRKLLDHFDRTNTWRNKPPVEVDDDPDIGHRFRAIYTGSGYVVKCIDCRRTREQFIIHKDYCKGKGKPMSTRVLITREDIIKDMTRLTNYHSSNEINVTNWQGQPISKLDDSHLRNAILFCERRFTESKNSGSVLAVDKIEDLYPEFPELVNEAKRRGFIKSKEEEKVTFNLSIDLQTGPIDNETIEMMVHSLLRTLQKKAQKIAGLGKLNNVCLQVGRNNDIVNPETDTPFTIIFDHKEYK